MADRWTITETTEGWLVERNGAWYSSETTEGDAVALISNQRGKQVEIEHFDGYRETRRL